MPRGEKDREGAAGEGDEEAVDADGGMDFCAGDADGEIEPDDREHGEGDGAEENEDGPDAEGSERFERFCGAEHGNDERERSKERDGADVEMADFL